MNHMRQLGLALFCYHEKWGAYPPAYVADENGKPMHSWRVLILPHIEQQALYKAYDFSEPWDGPNNRKLAGNIPPIYRCPSQHGRGNLTDTSYLAIVGPNTMWPGTAARKSEDVLDGEACTLLLVEAAESGIHWMEPQDLTVEEFLSTHASDSWTPQTDIHRSDHHYYYTCHWNALFGDCHSQPLIAPVPADVLSALVTVDGADLVPDDSEWRNLAPRRYWRWSRVVATAVFLLLCLLPLVRLARRRGGEGDQKSDGVDPKDGAVDKPSD